ncbi:LuxR C-terminal-related transcriptional regulator [Microvirga antarctica]|uniref:LuxR C-terminal-related transcriptional regulator n=1 Tax=Microvirga antarctica TaxID=2819233 RepID=UPI001B303836|nr:response regulator transcription factor [Microvirga antarctica]
MRKNYDSEALPDLGGSLAIDMYARNSPVRPTAPGASAAPDVPTLLFEPNTLLREGLRRMLAETAYRLVATGSNLSEVSQLAVTDERPFLAIVDAVTDHEAVLRQVEQLKLDHPAARAVVLVDRYDLKQLLAAFQAGADAYLIKTISVEVLLKSLDLVMLGETVFPSAAIELVGQGDVTPVAAVDHDVNEVSPRGLSVRETVILRCLMHGDSNKLIARKFDITEATVKVHVKAILRKIHAKNRTQAAIWAANNLRSTGPTQAE